VQLDLGFLTAIRRTPSSAEVFIFYAPTLSEKIGLLAHIDIYKPPSASIQRAKIFPIFNFPFRETVPGNEIATATSSMPLSKPHRTVRGSSGPFVVPLLSYGSGSPPMYCATWPQEF